jgi:translation initiation factor 1
VAERKDRSSDPGSGPFNNPFSSLSSIRDRLPEGKPATAARQKKEQVPARAVVRLERKGRGGKEVTVVSHLELKPDALAVWLKALKSELGCGGNVEDDSLVLQGDQRGRARTVLEARGVGRVTIG